MPTNSQYVLYQDDNGITNVNVRFDGEDVWLSQPQIAMLFDTMRENIVQHIRNIYISRGGIVITYITSKK